MKDKKILRKFRRRLLQHVREITLQKPSRQWRKLKTAKELLVYYGANFFRMLGGKE